MCSNFDVCGGIGNTNKYVNSKHHIVVTYCPLENQNTITIKRLQKNGNKLREKDIHDTSGIKEDMPADREKIPAKNEEEMPVLSSEVSSEYVSTRSSNVQASDNNHIEVLFILLLV